MPYSHVVMFWIGVGKFEFRIHRSDFFVPLRSNFFCVVAFMRLHLDYSQRHFRMHQKISHTPIAKFNRAQRKMTDHMKRRTVETDEKSFKLGIKHLGPSTVWMPPIVLRDICNTTLWIRAAISAPAYCGNIFRRARNFRFEIQYCIIVLEN